MTKENEVVDLKEKIRELLKENKQLKQEITLLKEEVESKEDELDTINSWSDSLEDSAVSFVKQMEQLLTSGISKVKLYKKTGGFTDSKFPNE